MEVRYVWGHGESKWSKKQKVKKEKDSNLACKTQTQYLIRKGKNKSNILFPAWWEGSAPPDGMRWW